ncbi:MAG: hypothetical protein GF308_13205 [Candidatus Heimdallarchaeota archaeon]|nr:hypothetical protein [Candidatus Heimdallarchaeota archaeon]
MSEDDSPIQEDFKLLVKQLKNSSDWNERFSAANKLFRSAGDKAVDPLIYALQNDPQKEVQRYAADLLGRLADPRASWALIAALRRGLKEEDFTMIYHTSEALIKIDGNDAIAILSQTIEDEQEFLEMKLKALEILSKIGDAKVVEKMIDWVHDPEFDNSLRKRVIEELAYMGHLASIQFLLDLLEERRDKNLQKVIVRALGKTPFKNKAIVLKIGDILLQKLEQEQSQPKRDVAFLNLLAESINTLGENIGYNYREFMQEIIDIRKKQHPAK